MPGRKQDDGRVAHAPVDALDRLVETERTLDVRLARAGEEAARLVAAARAAAAEDEAAAEGELARAIAELDARVERENRDELARADARARRRAAFYDGLGEPRMRELARRIVEVVAAGARAAPGDAA
jgi:hypothetical protein